MVIYGASDGSVVKNPPAMQETAEAQVWPLGQEVERSRAGGRGNPLQHSSLENPMDRGAWRATVHRIAKSWTWLKGLSKHASTLVMHTLLSQWLEQAWQYSCISWTKPLKGMWNKVHILWQGKKNLNKKFSDLWPPLSLHCALSIYVMHQPDLHQQK